MSVTAGIISGFDNARRTYRDAEVAKASHDQDREFSILSALAQHIDPELAKIGAAGLLNIAQGGTPKTGKGMRGFLGEVDKTSQMPALQSIFGAGAPVGAGATAAIPSPGSAAQPNSAAVDPERVANGPGIGVPSPGPAAGPPDMPQPGGGEASEESAGPPELQMGGGAPPMLPQGPPPPESPQMRSKRLFPTAGEIAADQAGKQLQARIKAVFDSLQTADTPDKVDIVRGLAGAPRRQSVSKAMNAEYRTAGGQDMTGTVIFDPVTKEAEVDGQPVVITKMLPTNQPRPIRTNMNQNGNVTAIYSEPSTGDPLWTVNTGMPINQPPEFGGVANVNGQMVQTPRRSGQAPNVLGDAPPPAGALTPEQQEATGWLTDVQAEVKAELAKANQNVFVAAQKKTALPVAQQNAIVAKISKGRFKTLGDLTTATKRSVGGGGDSRRDLGNRVRQRLEKGAPNIVQGSGLPPGM